MRRKDAFAKQDIQDQTEVQADETGLQADGTEVWTGETGHQEDGTEVWTGETGLQADETEVWTDAPGIQEGAAGPEADITEMLPDDETVADAAEPAQAVSSQRGLKANISRESFHLEKGVVLKERYVIGDVIGFGGFGTIYLCSDTVLGETVAVKEYYPTIFLSREPGKKQVLVYDKKNQQHFEKGKSEFLEEARSLAKFNKHSNIVHVYDFFEENGTAYFVMEYLDGCSLKVYLQERKKRGEEIEISEAVSITKSVLNALVELHRAGIIHRDIKPGNIFMCKNGAVKLIDLGAARFSNTETEKTRTVIITPGYAPAEQYQVKSKQGPYTDLYAVGAVLYEMVTGCKPDESINRKVVDTLVEPCKINRQVTRALNSVIMRSMAIQPEIRFQSAGQFLKALEKKGRVRDAQREIRHKKRSRGFRVVLIAAVLLLSGAAVGYRYEKMRRDAFLTPASISLWLPCEGDGDSAEELFLEMAGEYLDNYSMITLDITAIPRDQYREKVMLALTAGETPTLFESGEIIGDVSQYAASLSSFFEMSVYDKNLYYFLGQYSQREDMTQIPLTVDVPVLYRNYEAGDITEGYNTDPERFLNGEADHYLGYVSDFARIQRAIPGQYEVLFPEEQTELDVKYFDLFSVNANASGEEANAAMRLLYYFLSETSQDLYTIQNDNHLPLNKKIMDVFCDVNNDFDGITGYIERIGSAK